MASITANKFFRISINKNHQLGDRSPELTRAPFKTPLAYRNLWLLLHRELRNTARVLSFVDYLAEQIAARRNEFWVAGTIEP